MDTRPVAAPARPWAAALALLLLAGCGANAPGQQGAGPRTPDTASRLRLAAAAEMSGQTDVALNMLAAAAQSEPTNYPLQATYAAALQRAGAPADAERVVQAALARRPEQPLMLVRLGRLRLRSGQLEEALAIFDRARRAGAVAEAEDGRGVALDLLGRPAEAQAAYRAALAAQPDYLPAANNLAMSLLLDGKPQEALAVLGPLSLRGDAPPRVANNMAIARAMLGQTDHAGGSIPREELRGIAVALGAPPPMPEPEPERPQPRRARAAAAAGGEAAAAGTASGTTAATAVP
jgi:Flp pilus assembly protein TadD